MQYQAPPGRGTVFSRVNVTIEDCTLNKSTIRYFKSKNNTAGQNGVNQRSLAFRGMASHCFVQRLGCCLPLGREMSVTLHRFDRCHTNALSASTSLRSGTTQQKTMLRFTSPRGLAFRSLHLRSFFRSITTPSFFLDHSFKMQLASLLPLYCNCTCNDVRLPRGAWTGPIVNNTGLPPINIDDFRAEFTQ